MTEKLINLALFDFDGTISRRDSFLLFLRFVVGFRPFCFGCLKLTPEIGAFLAGRYANHDLKENFLVTFLAGKSLAEVEMKAKMFTRQVIPTILRQQAIGRIQWHQQRGDRVIVVTATPEPVLFPWCSENNLELVATRLEVKEGRVTGRIEGHNCRGEEKVRRIQKILDPQAYATIYAYGDTEGDRPLLRFADRASYKPFRD